MTVTAPALRLQLRDYQEDALRRVAEAEARGVRSQLIVAATGLGKTVVAAALAERRGGRVLFLAHRDELISQAVAKFRQVWPNVPVGVIKAADDDVDAHVVVASVQTLSRPARLDRLCGRFSGEAGLLSRVDPFDLVIVDEVHHAAARTYRQILDRLGAGKPDGPLLVGVTATPDRGDGKGLDDLFDEIVASYDLLWGIRSGYLSDLRGQRVIVDNLDLGGVKVSRGDYDQGQAGAALVDAGADQAILEAWERWAAGRRTIVFTPTVDLSLRVEARFAEAGHTVGHVDGTTPLDDRRRLLARFAAGDVQVITNCGVLTEGYDGPFVDCIVIARPTRSRGLYCQMVGRGCRRYPDKADCLVLDIVGATAEHSLVTVPSLFGLEGRFRERMGDGSGGLAGVVDERDQEQVRLGKMRAEDADLFRKVREAAGVAWVQVHREGDLLRRFVRSLGRDKAGEPLPTVVLAQRTARDLFSLDGTEEAWTAGLIMPDGTKRVLLADVPLETAQGAAEDFVRRTNPGQLVASDAPWRARVPSERQRAAAERWRVKVDPEWTAGELSDALDAHISRVRERAAAKLRAKASA